MPGLAQWVPYDHIVLALRIALALQNNLMVGLGLSPLPWGVPVPPLQPCCLCSTCSIPSPLCLAQP